MDYGNLLKIKRKNRNISRTELTAGITSVSYLQRVENTNSKIDFDILAQLLERMNIQFDEFCYEVNCSNSSKKTFFRKEFVRVINSPVDIHHFLNDLELEYHQSNDIFYLYLLIQMKVISTRLPYLESSEISSSEIKIIHEHLGKLDGWGYFELAMYVNCLSIFSKNHLTFNYLDVLSQFKKYELIPKYRLAEIKFLVNHLILCFEQKNYLPIPDLLNELYNQTEDSDYLKGRLYWKFFNELFLSMDGQVCFDPEPIVSLFHNLGYYHDVQNLRDIIKSAK